MFRHFYYCGLQLSYVCLSVCLSSCCVTWGGGGGESSVWLLIKGDKESHKATRPRALCKYVNMYEWRSRRNCYGLCTAWLQLRDINIVLNTGYNAVNGQRCQCDRYSAQCYPDTRKSIVQFEGSQA